MHPLAHLNWFRSLVSYRTRGRIRIPTSSPSLYYVGIGIIGVSQHNFSIERDLPRWFGRSLSISGGIGSDRLSDGDLKWFQPPIHGDHPRVWEL